MAASSLPWASSADAKLRPPPSDLVLLAPAALLESLLHGCANAVVCFCLSLLDAWDLSPTWLVWAPER